MMSKKIIMVFVLVFTAILLKAQLSGGGDLNPDLKAPKQAQQLIF